MPSPFAAVEAVDEGAVGPAANTIAESAPAPSTTSRRGCAAVKKARRVEPAVGERDLESLADEAPESTPTARIVDVPAVPLEPTLVEVSPDVATESAILATDTDVVTEAEPEPATLATDTDVVTEAEPEPATLATDTDVVTEAEPEPATLATDTDVVTEAEPEPAALATDTDVVTEAEPEPAALATDTDVVTEAEPEPAALATDTDVVTEAEPEPATLATDTDVVTELIPPWATLDQSIEPVSEHAVEPPSDETEDRWSRLVDKARSDRATSPLAPDGAGSEAAEVGPETLHGRPKSRWLRRAHRDDPSSIETPSPELAPAAEAVPEVTIEIVPAPTLEVATDVIVPEPTWNETEDQWRRLVAEAASGPTVASPATDAGVDIIVPAATPEETTGRWRRLVAEVTDSADDVEPVPTGVHVDLVVEEAVASAVVDLRTEASSRPSVDVGAAASMEIERLPRVGSDLRVMINAIRRRSHKSGAEAGSGSDALPTGSSAASGASSATAVQGRETVNALVRTSDPDEDVRESDG